MAAPGLASAQPTSQKLAFYANVGADLTHYDVDVAGAELIRRSTVTLPAGVQYAWPHSSRRYIYVATSSSAPGCGTAGTGAAIVCQTLDEFIVKLTEDGYPIDDAYLAAKTPWLQRQLHNPLGLGDRPFVVGRRPVAGEELPPRQPDLMLDDTPGRSDYREITS